MSRPARRPRGAVLLAVLLACFGIVAAVLPTSPTRAPVDCSALRGPGGQALPLPSTLRLDSMETLLYAFLRGGCYYGLSGWGEDKGVRDTGPFIDGMAYAPHPAVRIFYSPAVMRWLRAGRTGSLPDGAIMIKEMYDAPAARYAGASEAAIRDSLHMWTVMIRDSAASKDGWFWSFYDTIPPQPVDGNAYPFDYPNTGFGQYCVRCHSSASGHETFASLRNIAGEPGGALQYRVDDSWMASATGASGAKQAGAHEALALAVPAKVAPPRARPDPAFQRVFGRRPPTEPPVPLPPVTLSHVISTAGGPPQFVTSDQCMSCHDGQGKPFGPNMYIPPDKDGGGDVNLSPFGEWSWSLMGLSGRDPVFFAQLESEGNIHPTRKASTVNTCFSCHGVMGQRQLSLDQPGGRFSEDLVYDTASSSSGFRYGALARDGISCALCHQVVDDHLPFDSVMTGRFRISAPDSGESKVYGPFDTPTQRPMVESLGMRPEQSDYMTSPRLCGSCHTVHLPVYDQHGDSVGSFFEQATYLEWQNSAYRTGPDSGAAPRTCQSCHMSTSYGGHPLSYRIANIQDQTYPEADHLAPTADFTVNLRSGFARHTLAGANPFVLRMFSQFDSILGVRREDYMTGSSNGLPFAIQHAAMFARDSTADVQIVGRQAVPGGLALAVRVHDLAGHRFPTGVGFRRAFLAVVVQDAAGDTLWASGRGDAAGVLVDSVGRPLPSEFFAVNPQTGRQEYQPHYRCIDGQSRVEIYQELVQNTQGRFTTSFVSLYKKVKDNRLLPDGWTAKGPPGFAYAAETRPFGAAASDPDFGAGGDVVHYRISLPARVADKPVRVTAALYYQTIPPSYLRQRFATATGKDGERLAYFTSRLRVEGTEIDRWRLLAGKAIAQAMAGPAGPRPACTTGAGLSSPRGSRP